MAFTAAQTYYYLGQVSPSNGGITTRWVSNPPSGSAGARNLEIDLVGAAPYPNHATGAQQNGAGETLQALKNSLASLSSGWSTLQSHLVGIDPVPGFSGDISLRGMPRGDDARYGFTGPGGALRYDAAGTRPIVTKRTGATQRNIAIAIKRALFRLYWQNQNWVDDAAHEVNDESATDSYSGGPVLDFFTDVATELRNDWTGNGDLVARLFNEGNLYGGYEWNMMVGQVSPVLWQTIRANPQTYFDQANVALDAPTGTIAQKSDYTPNVITQLFGSAFTAANVDQFGVAYDFVRMWRAAALTMKAADPALLTFWNPVLGALTRPIAWQSYPGDDVVDIIGCDKYYSMSGSGVPDLDDWFDDLRLQWQAAFYRGKQFAIGECGIRLGNGAQEPLFQGTDAQMQAIDAWYKRMAEFVVAVNAIAPTSTDDGHLHHIGWFLQAGGGDGEPGWSHDYVDPGQNGTLQDGLLRAQAAHIDRVVNDNENGLDTFDLDVAAGSGNVGNTAVLTLC